MNRISIPVPGGHVRRLEDPTDEGRFSYHAYVRVCDLPTDLPLDVNPRKQNLRSLVSRKIKAGLVDEPQEFHLLNRGLTIIVQDASYNNHNGILTLEFPEEELEPDQDANLENGDKKPDDPYDMDGYIRGNSYGIVDGGHTYKVLLNEVEELKKARAQNQDVLTDPYVHLEVLVGVADMAISLARARNTSAQVKEQSLAELGNKFDWLKKVLEGETFADRIAYKENEDPKEKPIDVRDIIQILTAFHPGFLSREYVPIFSYTGAGRCLKMFVSEEEQYEKTGVAKGFRQLQSMVIDILDLYRHLLITFQIHYKNVGGIKGALQTQEGENNSPKNGRSKGRPGALHEFRNPKKSDLCLAGYSPVRIPERGLVMPLLSSFRALMKVNPATGFAEWKANPQELYDSNGDKYAKKIFRTADILGRKPNAVGKDANLWDNLYQEVFMDYLQKSGALEDYV